MSLPVVNTHVHFPPNFSAFTTVADVVATAVAEGARAIGISNFFDQQVYADFAEQAAAAGIIPLYGLEFITLSKELAAAGVRINDPANPGRMYLCGKGIAPFKEKSPTAARIAADIRQGNDTRAAQMVDKLAAHFAECGLDTGLTAETIAARVAGQAEVPAEWVSLQERHIAAAFQQALAELPAGQRAAVLERAYGGPSGVDTDDPVALQGELRSRLIKAGTPGFVAEVPLDFADAYDYILEMDGIPTYPTLADGADPVCPFEEPAAALAEKLLERGIYAAELIPVRNTSACVDAYVKAFTEAGLIVMAGTEHNTADRIPLAVACADGPVSDFARQAFWEAACVVAAHQHEVAHGRPGYVAATGDRTGADPAARRAELAALGADLINGVTATTADAEELVRVRNVVAPTLRGLLAGEEALAVVTSEASTAVRRASSSPAGRDFCAAADSMVGPPLVIEPAVGADLAAAVTTAVDRYRTEQGQDPMVVVIPGLVVFGVGADLAAARRVLAAFTGALLASDPADPALAHWAGFTPLPAQPAIGRMAGKVVMVTGAAQGFGLGIATELLAEGAQVVLADLNIELAAANAATLSEQYGEGRAVAIQVNVADEQSQLDAAAAATAIYGGLDVFISNAGVLRADGVMTQPVADFDLVTNVNYRGYFLGVRAVAPIMAAQHAARPEVLADIIEINSKSGLEGSKRNFAYAGSKFGGIGLTQSFALELIEYGIKVNAICPGNYLDGPLWTDPERGLFVQYLRAGKVAGATTVEEVRRSYEAKVPMGRGCLPTDLAKAVYYIVDQQYETGQAVPVTGGQNMLN